MNVQHAKVNWENFVPKVVKTLILGSFNPNKPVNNANYYYGRRRNYLWKAIGDILFNNQHHFFIRGQLNFELAILTMEKYHFCFLDLIDNIEVTGLNPEHEIQFITQKIHNKFSDSVLFTNDTGFQGNNINIHRNYNVEILELINEKTPATIIHTLGNITILPDFSSAKPDLNEFLNQIINLCEQSGTQLIPLSISPSQYNIHYNGLYEDLKNWLRMNLNL